MKNSDFPDLIANVAASYARRELDRSVYDRLMVSPLGVKLSGLNQKNKYALEFIAYSVAAVAVKHDVNASSVRLFVNSVVADAPTEIAKRVINGTQPICLDQVKAFLADMSDDDVVALIDEIRTTESSDEMSSSEDPRSDGEKQTILSELAQKIDRARRQIREKRGKRK